MLQSFLAGFVFVLLAGGICTEGLALEHKYSSDVEPVNPLFSETNASQLVVDRIKRFFKLNTASYCDEQDISSWNCGSRCQTIGKVSNVTLVESYGGTARGYTGLWVTEKRVIVVFRGLSKPEMWVESALGSVLTHKYAPPKVRSNGSRLITKWWKEKILKNATDGDNLNWIRKAPLLNKIKCNSYVLQAYLEIRDTMLSATASLLLKTGWRLQVTGFSFGAALTELFVADIAVITGADVPAIDVEVFAGGRIGNSVFAALVNQWSPNVRRFMELGDFLPDTPRREEGYTHPGFAILTYGPTNQTTKPFLYVCPHNHSSSIKRALNKRRSFSWEDARFADEEDARATQCLKEKFKEMEGKMAGEPNGVLLQGTRAISKIMTFTAHARLFGEWTEHECHVDTYSTVTKSVRGVIDQFVNFFQST